MAEILAESEDERRRLAEATRRYERAQTRRRYQWISIVSAALFATPALLATIPGVPSELEYALFGLGLAIFVLSTFSALQSVRMLREEGVAAAPTPLREQLEALRAAYGRALRHAVRGWLTAAINDELTQRYGTVLPRLNPEGLAEIDGLDREVPTAARAAMAKRLERMPGGSIGIAGPRGAGKTTLIRQVTAAVNHRYPVIGVVVDAPVEYDAREFVLHVFSKLCEEVLGPDRVAELRGWQQLPPRRATLRWLRWNNRPYPPLLGPALAAIGLLGLLAIAFVEGNIEAADLRPWALAVAVLGGLLTYVSLILSPSMLVDFARSLVPIRTTLGNPVATAELHLRQIWFQQSFSTGWSGSLKLPLGVQAGAEKTRQLAENQLSFPDVVGLYGKFVGLLTARGQVRIGIDELDKMSDETARRFLNEIKVIFRAPDCFYLVSVSEDAMSYFERRGLPFRDVFDSSFDEIVRVGYLDFAAVLQLLQKRVVGMPIQFAAVCHILGGGLPRDVIRVARELCEQRDGLSLSIVTARLVATQLRAKREAARIALRRLATPEWVLLLSSWLRALPAGHEIDPLLEKCRSFRSDFLTALGDQPVGDAAQMRDHQEALAIALEVLTFTYLGVTLVEFTRTLGVTRLAEKAAADSAFDELAAARQAFSVNPGEAWEAISSFRQSRLGESAVDFPLAV